MGGHPFASLTGHGKARPYVLQAREVTGNSHEGPQEGVAPGMLQSSFDRPSTVLRPSFEVGSGAVRWHQRAAWHLPQEIRGDEKNTNEAREMLYNRG